MDPSEDAPKKSRSVASQAKYDMGWGKWKVVNRDLDERSQSYSKTRSQCCERDRIPEMDAYLNRVVEGRS